MQNVSTKYTCKRCKNTVDVLDRTKDTRFITEEIKVSGKVLTVIIHKCAVCGHMEVVQMDDESTIKLRNAINELLIRACDSDDREEKAEIRKKIDHMDRVLTNKRQNIEKKYKRFLKKYVDKRLVG